MAKLELKTNTRAAHSFELRPGTNRLGRTTDCDVSIDHPTVSATHCEVLLGCGGLSVRDCGSTNGTFVDGTPVQEAVLLRGQTLRLGEVEFRVADTEIPISIPKFEVPVATAPVVLANGAVLCRRHRANVTVYECHHCHELLCEDCLHRLRRRGGKLLCLCPHCSCPVETTRGAKKKPSLLRRFLQTTKILFRRHTASN